MGGHGEEQRRRMDIAAGAHVCAVSTGRAERDAVLVTFLGDGLSAGHKCLFGLNDRDPWQLVRGIGSPGEVDRGRASHQLEKLGGLDMRFTAEANSVDGMLSVWAEAVTDSMAEGYDLARLGAEAAWWGPQLDGDAGVLAEYESALNSFVADNPVAILCMYDMRDCDGGQLIELMRTHPRLMIDGLTFDNPYQLEGANIRIP
jgi:hypothetical protein